MTRRPAVFLVAGSALLAAPARAQDTLPVVIEVHGRSGALERAATLPFRLIEIPLELMGDGIEAGLSWADRSRAPARVAQLFTARPLSLQLGGTGENSGAGIGVSLRLGQTGERGWSLEAGAQATRFGYRVERITARRRLRRLQLDAFAEHRVHTRDEFWGVGPFSAESARSDYGLKRLSAGARLFAVPHGRLLVRGALEWLREESGTGEQRDLADVSQRFVGSLPAGYGSKLTWIRPAVLATWDGRTLGPRGPAGPWVSVGFAGNRGLNGADPSFTEAEAEARLFIPLGGLRRTLAFRARAEVRRETGGDSIPFHRLTPLGGSRDLRGFRSNRFRDRDGILLSAEYRYRVWRNDSDTWGLDLAVIADDGAVMRDLFQDLDARLFHGSYGAGLRLTATENIVARLELARGREGTRLHMRAGAAF